MRKILLYTLTTLAAAGMASCEDFLTRDTYDQIGSDEFWKSETDLELYANGFIQKMIPGDGTITRGDIYADYCAVDIPTDLLRPDGNVSPDNQTGWAESNWTNLRRVNYMLDNMHKCRGRVSDEIYNHYEGVARFWRAWFYYDKVQTFGAVPWYDFTIAASDKEAMMKPRDSREYVMDKVLEDLTFASTYCLSDAKFTKGSALINKWVALAFKSRVCLYEGTFRKYHSREPSSDKPWQAEYNADNKFLREAAAAAKEIMDKGPYSLVTGDVKTAYRSLFTSAGLLTQEVIFGRERLYSPNWKVTRTGYHPIKWSIDDDADNVLSKAASWNSLPILRYAEVLLNYAEAKAELGEMDAAVWDQTIAQLRSRAGVTPVVPDKADPYMEAYFLNTVTDKWILEVRRERGIELCLEMGLRWDDDMRWHMGDLLTSDNNPWTGIWIGNTGYTYDFTGQSTDDNGDPVPDFYIRPGEDTEHSIAISNTGANQTFSLNAAGNIVWEYKRTWGEKKYLRPIPQTAITRNPNLEQNALWK